MDYTELYREEISRAELVANPGCYPTSAILPLAPLVKAGVISGQGIIVDSKSGVTGAGRTPKLPFHYPECNESIKAYGVGTHRHAPEIAQFISSVGETEADAVSTPHLVPMNRGILSTCYVQPVGDASAKDAMAILDGNSSMTKYSSDTHSPRNACRGGNQFCRYSCRRGW